MARRGRAKASSVTFMMSLPEGMSDRLDELGDQLDGRPSRQEVIRQILSKHIGEWETTVGIEGPANEPSDGE